MMHPTLAAALAAERHADLMRTAEARRRVAPSMSRQRRSFLTRAAAGLRGPSWLRNRIAASTQPQSGLCCA